MVIYSIKYNIRVSGIVTSKYMCQHFSPVCVHVIYQIFILQRVTGMGVANRKNPSQMKVCLKLTAQLGITWLFGFVYAIAPNSFLEYIFVFLCSCQGE